MYIKLNKHIKYLYQLIIRMANIPHYYKKVQYNGGRCGITLYSLADICFKTPY